MVELEKKKWKDGEKVNLGGLCRNRVIGLNGGSMSHGESSSSSKIFLLKCV